MCVHATLSGLLAHIAILINLSFSCSLVLSSTKDLSESLPIQPMKKQNVVENSEKDGTQLGFLHNSGLIKATNSALVLEQERIQRCYKLKNGDEERNSHFLTAYLNMGISHKIQQLMRTDPSLMTGKPTDELIELLNKYPRLGFITNSIFAEKFLSSCLRRMDFYSGLASKYAQTIALVSSKVPQSMDFILSELNRVCIYTVPKHIEYSEEEFESKEKYYKAIGYEKEESHESYLARLGNYMRLYGALVRTDKVDGSRVGWGWLVRFLTGLPPNVYTLVALEGFLRMAGFDLYKTYRVHFKKWLDFVAVEFLGGLRTEEEDGGEIVGVVRKRIRDYIEGEEFLDEPAVFRLQECKPPHLIIMECAVGCY